MTTGIADAHIDAVRHFNRLYTRQLGVLDEGLLKSAFSLTEARVLYELAQREQPTASELTRALGLDPGYLSRLLKSFEKRGLIRRTPSGSDGRQHHLMLTRQGKGVFAQLDRAAHDQVSAMLAPLSEHGRLRLVEAMQTIERLLGARPEPKVPYLLRPPRPGDMGWVVHRHGVLYAGEYGWDETFEALVAEIVAQFIRAQDPRRERCWIAEREGRIAGSVFAVKESDTAARLRLLYVEPEARGLGIGRHLVDECIRFARQAGYRELTLWTNDVLVSARRIYEATGFRLVKEERHRSFGHELVGQHWALEL